MLANPICSLQGTLKPVCEKLALEPNITHWTNAGTEKNGG